MTEQRDVNEDWLQVEFYGEDREVSPGDNSMGPYDRTEDSFRIEQPGADFTVSLSIFANDFLD